MSLKFFRSLRVKANSCILHQVPVMIQPKTWACWYTSMQMVVAYFRRPHVNGPRLIDPPEDSEASQIFKSNQGIGNTPDERERIAKRLGFSVGYISMSSDGLWGLLRKGPVIYAGQWPGQMSGHWVVITGISEDLIAINNPAVGAQTWDYGHFAGKYLLQTADRPLVYVDY